MTDDPKTRTITVSGDPKQLQQDMFKYLEEINRLFAEDPNCPPDKIKAYETYRKANEFFGPDEDRAAVGAALDAQMGIESRRRVVTVGHDPKKLEREMFKYREEMMCLLVDDPNCPAETLEEYKKLKAANQVTDLHDKLVAMSDTVGAFKASQVVVKEQLKSEEAQFGVAKRSMTIIERLQALPKSMKACIVFAIFWTVFVFYRTVGSHYLLGFYLEQWEEDGLLINWLAFPAVVAAVVAGVRWVLSDRQVVQKSKVNPLTEFKREIAASWPEHQAATALELIRATLAREEKAKERLSKELTAAQRRNVAEVIRKMGKA